MRALVYAGVLSALALPARAEIYECVDESGSKRFTNIAAEAKGCKALNIGPIETAPPTPGGPSRPSGKAPPSATPSTFPRVDRSTQQARDTDRRRILEQELSIEEKLLDQAKQDLAAQRTSSSDPGREAARLQPLQNRVRLHEDNITNLRRELARLR